MVYRGRVQNGVVVIEEGGGLPGLPEGTVVAIEPIEHRKPMVGDDPVYKLGDLAIATGIPDLAINIDHYLYGHPKVDDAGR